MRIGRRLFPYPLLNNEKLYSQFKDSTFALQYEELITNENYVLKNIKCEVTNSSLIELINMERASIVCVIECAGTMFRKSYKLSTEPTSIIIPLTDLNGKISVSAYIVANEDIENYFSDDFFDDYEGINFYIEKNDILAVDDGFFNKIDFDEEQDTKKSSIFVIIKDKTIKDETMQIEYDSSKIIISLPEEQWNTYEKTKRIKKFESMYFSIIAIPALSYALASLQAKSESVDSLRMDYKWFNSFMIQYANIHEGQELVDEEFIKMNPHLEAQLMMNLAVTKSLDDIFGLAMGNFGGMDDGD